MEGVDDRTIIARVLSVFARNMPVSLLQELFAHDVVLHMDRLRLNVGRNGLETWFRYMHAIMCERQMSVDIDNDTIEMLEPGHYHVSGVLRTRRQNGRTEARRFTVIYLIKKGRVAAVWSTRSNYVGILGTSIELPLYIGYIYHCLRAWYYKAGRVA